MNIGKRKYWYERKPNAQQKYLQKPGGRKINQLYINTVLHPGWTESY